MRSFLVAIAVGLFASSQADISKTGGNCKSGYTLYENATASHFGCYKYVNVALNWTEAGAYCKGEAGALAAVRNQQEQTLLEVLRTSAGFPDNLFWVSGNSLNTNTFVWGDPYSEIVDFTGRWTGRGSIVRTIPRGNVGATSTFPAMVLLNGYRAAYAWDIVSGTDKHHFVCRKEACAGEQDIDIVRGICWDVEKPAEVDKGKGWIVGVVVGLAFALLIGGCVYGWYTDAEWVRTIVKGCRADKVHFRTSFHHNPRASQVNEPRATAISQLPTLKSADNSSYESEPTTKRLSNQVGGTVPVAVTGMLGGLIPTVEPGAPPAKQAWKQDRNARPKSTPKSATRFLEHAAPPQAIESLAIHHTPSFHAPSMSMASSTGMGANSYGHAGARTSLKKGQVDLGMLNT